MHILQCFKRLIEVSLQRLCFPEADQPSESAFAVRRGSLNQDGCSFHAGLSLQIRTGLRKLG